MFSMVLAGLSDLLLLRSVGRGQRSADLSCRFLQGWYRSIALCRRSAYSCSVTTK